MGGLFSLCGYDTSLIDKVGVGERRYFVLSALVSLLAVVIAGAGMAYGAVLTVGVVAAPVAFVVAALFVLNLLRLQHAGSGYPLHFPIEEIHHWRPALTGVAVLLVLGSLMVQPLVFLVEKPWLDLDLARRADEALAVRTALGISDVLPPVADGLIARGRAAWDLHVVASALLTAALAFVIAGPALLRRLGASVLRHYESERWITDRILVDDEWAWARDVVESTLMETAPGFSPPLQVPFADPPYNTRPLVFGLDPQDFVEGRLKYMRVARKRTVETPTIPVPAEPWWTTLSFAPQPLPPAPALAPEAPTTVPAAPAPTTTAPTAPTAPMAPTVAPTPTPTPQPPHAHLTPQPPLPEGRGGGEPGVVGIFLSVTDVGRLVAGAARTNVRAMAVCARYLELPPGAVLQALQAAADDVAVHVVFPAWNKLPTILLQRADVALQVGLAPLIAIVVDRPADQVERRLRAAVGDAKVSSVFAPELARRLLREKPGAATTMTRTTTP